MSENKKKYLQETRENAMPTLIERYNGLVNNLFDAVGKPLPKFTDIDDGDGEIVKTAEQQLYAFIKDRKDALQTANEMLNTINVIEREREDPEAFHDTEKDEQGIIQTTVTKVHPSKRNSKQ